LIKTLQICIKPSDENIDLAVATVLVTRREHPPNILWIKTHSRQQFSEVFTCNDELLQVSWGLQVQYNAVFSKGEKINLSLNET
jgi:hypothetical protein